jgi:hypothetical protein
MPAECIMLSEGFLLKELIGVSFWGLRVNCLGVRKLDDGPRGRVCPLEADAVVQGI